MKLTNSDIRRIILNEHGELRRRLRFVEDTLDALAKGEAQARADATERLNHFYDSFLKHIAHEERILEPVLHELTAWGPVTTAGMDEDHKHQRAEIERLRMLKPELNEEKFIHDVRAFVAELYTDMAEEERTCLDPRILRDDVIVIDGMSG